MERQAGYLLWLTVELDLSYENSNSMCSTADKTRRAQRRRNWANAGRLLTIIGTAVADQLVVLFLSSTRQKFNTLSIQASKLPQMTQIMLSVMGYAP
jgi:hypothetical protein